MATFMVLTIALSPAISRTAFFSVGLLRAFSGKRLSVGGALNLVLFNNGLCVGIPAHADYPPCTKE